MKLTPPPLSFDHVGLVYRTSAGAVRVFDDLCLEVPAGQFVSIIGKSGCGKSSLLKVAGSLIKPTSGVVHTGGEDADAARRSGTFSFCFQNPVLLGWRTCLENVRLPAEIMRRSGAQDPAASLRLVGLAGWEGRYPHELSGGMKQRVALARALSYNASVLILDEPFASVDEINRTILNRQLADLWANLGFTCLLTTHSVLEAVTLADRVLVVGERGAGIVLDLQIPLPRPRGEDVLASAEYHDLVRSLRGTLGL